MCRHSLSVMCLAAECWTYSGVKWIAKKRRFHSAASKTKIILPSVFWVRNSRNLSLEMGMCRVFNHLEVATATDSCSQTWAGTVGAAMKSFLLLSLLCKKLSCGLGQGFLSGSPSSRLINLLISKHLAGVDVILYYYDFYCSSPLWVSFDYISNVVPHESNGWIY